MKKIINLSFLGFSIVVILLLMFNFLAKQNYGHLKVQTNDVAAKISLIPKSPAKEFSIGTGEHAQKTIKPGQYILQAVDQNRISQMEVNIPVKGNISVFLSINSTSHVNDIANFSAQDLSVSGSNIEFLNTALQQIYNYDVSSGSEQTIAGDLYPVTKVLWINHQSAVAIDDIKNPHYINGQSDSAFSIITTVSNNPVVQDFAVNSRGDFAYAQGGNVYLSKSGKINVISQNNSSEVQVRLAEDDTVFINGINPSDPNVSLIDVGVPTKSVAYFITPDGQKISYSDSTTINEVSWSTDSQTIAVSTNDNLSIYNYKTKKSTIVALPGISPNSSFNWVDANRLMYVNKNVIWQYDLSQNISHKLASATGTINHEIPFAVSNDGSIYFSTDSSNAVGTGAAIYQLIP